MNNKRHIILKLVIAFVCIVPPLVLVALSFFQQWTYPHLLPNIFTGEAWQFMFSGKNNIAFSIFTSVIIALAVAALSATMGFFTSLVIAYHTLKKQLLILAYLPFVLSPVIFAVCLKFYFIKMGLIGTLGGVVLAQLIVAYPYATILFISFWNSTMSNYMKLAQTLGSTPAFAFRKIIVPIAVPMLMVAFFQCFLISWFEYGLTLVIGFGKVQTLTIKVFQFLTEANLFYAALSCSLLVIPPIVLLWINRKFIYHKMA